MKSTIFALCCAFALHSAARAGSEGVSSEDKSKKEPAPSPQWYADNEWNVSLWGAYAFIVDGPHEFVPGEFAITTNFSPGYFGSDEAWGGGISVKYFFKRYFGVGIEGYVVDATRTIIEGRAGGFLVPTIIENEESRVIGSVLGTFTLRYPLPRSRFAPYAYVGGGAIFGGGQTDGFTYIMHPNVSVGNPIQHTNAPPEAVGEVGAGCELRLTPHIGLMSDFSWNVIEGGNNNFGMVRSGLTFAF